METFAISAARRDDGLVSLTRYTGTHIESVVLCPALSAGMTERLAHERAAEFATSLWRSVEAVPALAVERTTTAITLH